MTRQRSIISERKIKLGKYIVKVDRIKKGKVQRKKLISGKKGYKISGKRAKRMSTREIRKRKIAMRKAVIKRRAKAARALKKRRISLIKGKRLGLYK